MEPEPQRRWFQLLRRVRPAVRPLVALRTPMLTITSRSNRPRTTAVGCAACRVIGSGGTTVSTKRLLPWQLLSSCHCWSRRRSSSLSAASLHVKAIERGTVFTRWAHLPLTISNTILPCVASLITHLMMMMMTMMMIYLLTAIGLPPGDSNTVHIYT